MFSFSDPACRLWGDTQMRYGRDLRPPGTGSWILLRIYLLSFPADIETTSAWVSPASMLAFNPAADWVP